MTADVSTQVSKPEITRVSENSRVWAVAAYLLLAVGGLLVYLLNRKDEFAIFHARQSLWLTFLAIFVPGAWVVVAWLIALIPLVGPLLAVASFSLVIAFILAWLAAWIFGMIHALSGRQTGVPFFGNRVS